MNIGQQWEVKIMALLIDNYLKKKDKINIERPRELLIDRYTTRERAPVIETKESKSLLDRIKSVGTGIGKFAARTGIEAANLFTSTLDFAADFLSGSIEKQTRRLSVQIGGPLFSIPIGKETEVRKKAADRWKNFYASTGGEVTEKMKFFTEGLRKIDFIQPSEEWINASTKDKFTKKLPETILNIGPGVVSSLGMFAINPALGFAVSAGSVADEIKTVAMENGVSEERAELLGLGTGLFVGWLDKIVPDEVFSPQQKKTFISGFAKRILKTGLKEAGTEILQENVQLLAEATVREDITKDEVIIRNLMSGLGGVLGGVGAQTTVSFVNGIRSGDIGGLEEDFKVEKVEKPVEKTIVKPAEPIRPITRELESLYHGTSVDIKGGKLEFGAGDIKKGGQAGGLFLTDDPDIAKVFGEKVYKASHEIRSEVVDLTKDSGVDLFRKQIGKTYKTFEGEITKFTKRDFDLMFPKGKADFASVSQYPELVEKVVKSVGKRGIAFNEFAGGKIGKTYQILEGEIPIKLDIPQQPVSDIKAKKPKKPETKLPSSLSRAKPRYNFGRKTFIPEFVSDIDKALYITAQKNKSKNDGLYRDFLIGNGFSDTEIDSRGAEVRDLIKQQASILEGGTQTDPQVIRLKDQRFFDKTELSRQQVEVKVVGVKKPTFKKPKPVKIEKKVSSVKEEIISVTDKKIENVKDIKGVRSILRNIRNELGEAIVVAEGRATVAQEQRRGLNIYNATKLKRIWTLNKKFREGDIETIRKSKSRQLVNDVIENVQELHPKMDEQEAFDFAIELPTKADETVRTPDIRALEKKEKTLRKYLDALKSKQKGLKIEEDDILFKEWQEALSLQEKLVKIIEVPRAQLPVGEGKEKVSRLQARLKGALENTSQEDIEELGLTTYRQMNQDAQIAKAVEYVTNNTEEALKVVRGEIDPPKGILQNSIFAALVELGQVDTDVATQIATLTATRFGQEINILKKIFADNPVVMMQDIVKTRIKAYEKRTGKKVSKRVKQEITKITKKVQPTTKEQWNSFLSEIRC